LVCTKKLHLYHSGAKPGRPASLCGDSTGNIALCVPRQRRIPGESEHLSTWSLVQLAL